MQLELKRPVVRTSLSEIVYENILESIVAGTLSSGTELNEVALAEELQVSRTPVHEALRRLAADGLVELLATKRARVARFDEKDLLEIYEMRKLLEGAAAERAARRATGEDLAGLRKELRQLMAARADEAWAARAIAFDLAFHQRIAELSGNAALVRDIARYKRLVQGFCRITGTSANLKDACREHARLLDALEAGDARAARREMEAHIENRMQVVLRERGQTAAKA